VSVEATAERFYFVFPEGKGGAFLKIELTWFERTGAVKFRIELTWFERTGAVQFRIELTWFERSGTVKFRIELTWFERTGAEKFYRRAEDRLCGLETYWRNQYAGASCAS
jgi:hypothetical protein